MTKPKKVDLLTINDFLLDLWQVWRTMHGQMIIFGKHCSNNAIRQRQNFRQLEENSFLGEIEWLYPAVKFEHLHFMQL